MKIKIIQNLTGYTKDETYDLPEKVARAFIDAKMADPAPEPKEQPQDDSTPDA